ncbi:hypothetical protein NDI54_02140 [Haloarcula sp. S1AR25-5A]|uniref:Uncharacterized protein n=1 Tax=Haloarcula terrestris TaxID=2950533 RepID=A0AAE4JH35_9EURY|nr:hypothetical protein [Haloarcula terrestris]MDS0220144.1 hypothetical protein [Haloarcula terrestris]
MAKEHAEDEIRDEKSNAHSTDEQVEISHGMWDYDVGPAHDGIKRANVEDELHLDLDHKPKTSLKHLVDIDMVEEFRRPGPDTFVIADWRDEDAFIMGEVEETATEAIEALIDHMHDDDPIEGDDTPAVADGAGPTIRNTVASAFDYKPAAVEEQLRIGDPLEKLNDAVEAIQEEDDLETRDDYGEIVFINQAYRYRLTPKAVRLYERDEEDDE